MREAAAGGATPYYSSPSGDVVLWQGDATAVLRALPAGSVHTCITSPPYYQLRDYKADGQIGLERTLGEYVAALVAVFRGVWRVLRDDGTLWINLGDCYNAYNGNRGTASQYAGRRNEMEAMFPTGYGLMEPSLKQKDLCGVPWRVAFALQDAGWTLRSDIVWCLSGGTRVYARTQKGEMPTTIKDLVRLDPATVQLWNGEKWTQALGWSQSPRPDVPLEIELRSGERIGCTPGHEWPTRRGLVRADNLSPGDVILTTRLPQPQPPAMASWVPDLTGWFVGLYMAEGSRSGDTIQIASHARETERFERLCRLAEAYHGTCRMHATGGNKAMINLSGPMLNGLIDTYVGGRLARDKHLNVRAWQRSNTFLYSVLDGYLSGDGHWDEANRRWRFAFTYNDALAADLRTIAARLDFSIRLKRVQHVLNGRHFPGWRGQLRKEPSNHPNNKQDGEVVAIRASRARKFWDIGVADEPHLFALASGVLTHNSKPNPMPESVRDRPTRAHEYVFLLSKGPRYFYDADAIREPHAEPWRGKGERESGDPHSHRADGAARGLGRQPVFVPAVREYNPAGRNRRSVWEIATEPVAFAHFACFPQKLVEPCLLSGTSARGCCPACGAPWLRTTERGDLVPDAPGYKARGALAPDGFVKRALHPAGTPQGHPNHHYEYRTTGWRAGCACADAGDPIPAVVLDPFAGSGTVGVVARKHGRHFIGVDLSEPYLAMARERLGQLALPGMGVG